MMSKNVARLAGASMFLGVLLPFSAHAIAALKSGTLEVAPLQSYFHGSF